MMNDENDDKYDMNKEVMCESVWIGDKWCLVARIYEINNEYEYWL